MALSNTATPIYYGRFREAVMRGEIPVCREISMEMNRIDDLIANPGVYYDDKAVNGFIKFCERELTLTDGSDLKLLDSFKLWAEEIFGWYYFVERSVYVPDPGGHGGHYERKRIKKRLITKQYLIITRAAAKTMYLECLQAYFMTVDKSTTQQVTTAPTMKQAEEVLSPFRTALARARGPVFKFMTMGSIQNTTGAKSDRVKMASTKKGIENFLTGSLLEIRPMTIEKLQGRRDRVATVDEWLSCDIREDPIGAIEQGAAKNEDYLIVAASSEGTVRNGCGDTIKMELMEILKGEYVNPHVSIFYYKLDSIDEVGKPEMWLKANPNLGQTVSYDRRLHPAERVRRAGLWLRPLQREGIRGAVDAGERPVWHREGHSGRKDGERAAGRTEEAERTEKATVRRGTYGVCHGQLHHAGGHQREPEALQAAARQEDRRRGGADGCLRGVEAEPGCI
jgi:phage terminase large subunit-like protein